MGLQAELQAQLLIIAEAKQFTNRGVKALKAEMTNANLRKTGALINATKGKINIKYGDLDRVSFTTLRYGFIQNAGIKTPYEIHSGQIMAARPGVNWVDKGLRKPTSHLADFIAKTNANAVVKILDFKVK